MSRNHTTAATVCARDGRLSRHRPPPKFVRERSRYRAFSGGGFFRAFLLRTSADLAAAFLAISERCCGVMVSSRRLPPFRPIFRRYSENCSGSLSFAMSLA